MKMQRIFYLFGLTLMFATIAAAQQIPDLRGRWKNFDKTEYEIRQSGSTFTWRVAKFGGYGDPNETGTGQILDRINIKGTVTTKDGTFPLTGTIAFYLNGQVGTILWDKRLTLSRIDAGTAPATVKLKIGTTTSCSDSPNESFQAQSGVTVYIGEKAYTSNEKGVIETDLPAGSYPVGANWKDYVFGYVSVNGLKSKITETGLPIINLGGNEATLEVRMLTCDVDGRAKPRAIISEMNGSTVTVFREGKSINASPGLHLRDGDTVKIDGKSRLTWLENNGTIDIEKYALIHIGPDQPSVSGSRPEIPRPSAVQVLKGLGAFFFPKTDTPDFKFQASTRSMAAGIYIGPHNEVSRIPVNRQYFMAPRSAPVESGLRFTVSYDDAKDVSTIEVSEGSAEVTPVNKKYNPFILRAGQRAEISPTGVSAPTQAPAGGASPGGVIYLGGGWNWKCCSERWGENLTIRQTGNQIRGEFHNAGGVITSGEINGTTVTFHVDYGTGRDYRLTVTPDGQTMTGSFTGDTPSTSDFRAFRTSTDNNAPPVTPPVTPPGNPPVTPPGPLPMPDYDLTGLWRNPGGKAVYRVRQIGTKFVWGLDAVSIGSYANMFQGQISGKNIDGVWEDLPGSPTIGGGRMLLKIESECRFVRVSSVNQYGADIWLKVGSRCDDVVGLTQKTGTAGAATSPKVVITDPLNKPATQNTTTSKPKPKVEEIPYDVTEGKPSGKATKTGTNTSSKPKPKVEEIPDDETTASATNKSAKPKVEEIPDDKSSPVTTTNGAEAENNTTANSNPVATPKPKTPKPKNPNGDFWGNLGRAIGEAAKATQQKPATSQTTTQPQKPTGTCRGGSFWLGSAVPNPAGGPDGYKIPWSLPFGATGYQIILFRADTNEYVTNTDLPNNQNGCGVSWELYFDARAPYDAYIYQGKTRVYGPVPIARPPK